MNTELATDFFLSQLVRGLGIDSLFVEVGLGSSDWSFLWAAPLGFQCVAVEPVPVTDLNAACAKNGVRLIEAAVGRHPGVAELHLGEVNGYPVPDTSSLNAEWWAAGTRSVRVAVTTLGEIVHNCGNQRIACLKVDVEGTEADVLAGMQTLAPETLPEVVAFEYGGGGTRVRRDGGWSEKGFCNTTECLTILADLGYVWGLVCERVLPQPVHFEFGASPLRVDSLFPIDAEVGNIIACRMRFPPDLETWNRAFQSLDRRKRLISRCREFGHALQFQIRRYRQALLRRIFPGKSLRRN